MNTVRRLAASIAVVALAATGLPSSPAHADDARLNLTSWNLPAQKVTSAACVSFPVQARVSKAPGATLWSVEANIMKGSTLIDGIWTDEYGKDLFDFCPAYGDTFGAYTFGPSVVTGMTTDYNLIEASDSTKGTLYIRRASKVSLATSKYGSYVTLKGQATRFSVGNYTGKYVGWPSAPLNVQYRNSSGAWVTSKTLTASSTGTYATKVSSTAPRVWRVTTGFNADTASSASSTSTR